MKKSNWSIFPFVVFIGLVLFFWLGLNLDPHKLPSVQIGKTLPQFQIPDLLHEGKKVSPSHFAGKVVLLNFWGSWCQACAEEQTMLLELKREGIVLYGVNYKDYPDQARQWLKEWGNPFQEIGEDMKGELAIDLGVYGAPETFIIDKHGMIRYRHVGVITPSVWNKELKPLIRQLESQG